MLVKRSHLSFFLSQIIPSCQNRVVLGTGTHTWGGNQNPVPEEGSIRKLKARTCGKQQRKTHWWQEQRLTVPQELAQPHRPLEVWLVSRVADIPGSFTSALRAQRQVSAQSWWSQARLLEAEPPAPADWHTNSWRPFHEHFSEDSSCDAKYPQGK